MKARTGPQDNLIGPEKQIRMYINQAPPSKAHAKDDELHRFDELEAVGEITAAEETSSNEGFWASLSRGRANKFKA